MGVLPNEGARLCGRRLAMFRHQAAQPKPTPTLAVDRGPSIPVVESTNHRVLGTRWDTLQKQGEPGLAGAAPSRIREIGCANGRCWPITCQNAVTASARGPS